MKDDALISVLIPAYNHENYIQDTIDSVIRQTYNNIELIILDDGSSDNTLAKIKEYESKCQKRFKRFLYSTQKNQGTVKTLNSLLSKAKGEYIAMIASDDMYYDEALELELEELKKDPNVSLVTGRSLYINSQGKVCYLNSKQQLTVSISCAKWKDYNDYVSSTRSVDYLSNNFGSYDSLAPYNYISNGYLIKRSFLDKVLPFKEQAPMEDYWLMLQLSKISKFKFIDKPLFYYRQHDTNTIKNKAKMKKMGDMTLSYERTLYLKEDTKDMNEAYLEYKNKYIHNAVVEYDRLAHFEIMNLELSKIEKQLKQANISNVYVYCFNDLGQAVYERLYYSNYNVICMFDQNAKNIDQKDVKVVQFDPKYLEPNSAVIVASGLYQDEIIEFISKDCKAKNVKILSFNPIFS